MKHIMKIVCAGVLSASSVSGHSLWVNAFESFSHQPGHVSVGLGWGHALPIDDMLNSPNGKVMVEHFTLTSPKGQKTMLRIPSHEVQDPAQQTSNFDVYDADVGLQKIALKKEREEGVYHVSAKSKPTFYTQYIDTKGNTRLKLAPLDEVQDVQKILMSVKYEAFANAYVTLGKWEAQKATGKGLEILPKTDLSTLRVGDLVEFEVLFYGEPLHTSAQSMDYISASSSTFGQNDGFALMSYIQEGKAQFRVQSPGQWIVTCNHKDTVDKEGKLKDLVGKVQYVFNGASLTFHVKE